MFCAQSAVHNKNSVVCYHIIGAALHLCAVALLTGYGKRRRRVAAPHPAARVVHRRSR